jgi:hypothetical protein
MLTTLQNSELGRRVTEAVRQDPKMYGVLGVLSLVLVVMGGRVVFTGSTGPASAGAYASTNTSSAVGARGTGVTGKGASSASSASRLPDVASAALTDWVRTTIPPVSRNLFAVKLDYYPQDGSKVDQTLRIPEGNGFWDKLAKSMALKADARKERQILVENLKLQAMQLKLQSTVMGATPRALIDGGMVREGDVIASFRVLKIEARRIIVEREGIKLEIPMK